MKYKEITFTNNRGILQTVELRQNTSMTLYDGSWHKGKYGKFVIVGSINDPYINKSGARSYRSFLVQFKDGTSLIVNRSSISKGNIKNRNKPSIYGVGCIGQGVYRSRLKGDYTREYILWHSMLERCYNTHFYVKYPTYKDCFSEKRWHNFQDFCEDIKDISGYQRWKDNNQCFHLDKDIKIKGNKLYSKDTCLFVTAKENIDYSLRSRKPTITGDLYKAKNLQTKEVIYFYNQTKFAKDHNLGASNLNKCLQGKFKQCKGWVFSKEMDKLNKRMEGLKSGQ